MGLLDPSSSNWICWTTIQLLICCHCVFGDFHLILVFVVLESGYCFVIGVPIRILIGSKVSWCFVWLWCIAQLVRYDLIDLICCLFHLWCSIKYLYMFTCSWLLSYVYWALFARASKFESVIVDSSTIASSTVASGLI